MGDAEITNIPISNALLKLERETRAAKERSDQLLVRISELEAENQELRKLELTVKELEQDRHIFAARWKQAKRSRLEILLEASRAVCGYCNDTDNWFPAKKGKYPEWWHLSAHRNANVRNGCGAWAIHHLIERVAQGEWE